MKKTIITATALLALWGCGSDDNAPDLNASVLDSDNDGVVDTQDAFPFDSAESSDRDGDGVGDNGDAFALDAAAAVDSDQDGYPDSWNEGKSADDSSSEPRLELDAFINDAAEWRDSDGDGVGDNSDAFALDAAAAVDGDQDGYPDSWNEGKSADDSSSEPRLELDAFIGNANEWRDSDGDGVGDNSDAFVLDAAAALDSDQDGYPDSWNEGKSADDSSSEPRLELDAFINDANEWRDGDGDGVGDNSDAFPTNPTESLDSDGDGVGDHSDAFPLDAAAAVDSDQDGYPDSWNEGKSADDSSSEPRLELDAFINDAAEWRDSDGDGIGDNSDAFPENPSESLDSDGDGVGDNSDAFALDAAAAVDSDGDGYPDNWNATKSASDSTSSPRLQLDAFPNDNSEWLDTDGDGLGNNSDPDDDNDGILDEQDPYPLQAEINVNSDLIAYWDFNQQSGNLSFDAVNGLAAQLNGTTELVASPRTKALQFNDASDGNQITIDHSFMQQVTDQFSISFWQKGYGVDKENNLLYGVDAANNRVIQAHVPYRGTKVYMDWGSNPDNPSGYDRLSVVAPETLTQNNWHHWVMTKNMSTGEMKLYFDGSLIASAEAKFLDFNQLQNFDLGNRFFGQIDEIKFFNKAISQESVNVLYSNQDSDGDGVADFDDPFPVDGSEWLDSDGDGIGNNSDSDDDNDALTDDQELALGTDQLNPDSDGDTLTDAEEVALGTNPLSRDSDGDGIDDAFDSEPLVRKTIDSDGDGVADELDAFPFDAGASVDADVDGLPDAWHSNMQSTEGRQLDDSVNVPSNLEARKAAIALEHARLVEQTILPEFTMSALLSRLDLTLPELSEVNSAYQAGNITAAGEELLNYYRTKFTDKKVIFNPEPLTLKEHQNFLHYFWGDDSEMFFMGDEYDWVNDPSSYAEWMIQHTREFGDIQLIYQAYQATGNKLFFDEIIARFVSYFEHAYPFRENLAAKYEYGVKHPFSNAIRGHFVSEMLTQVIASPHFDQKMLAYLLNGLFHSLDFVTQNYTASGNHLTYELQYVMENGFLFNELTRASEPDTGWIEDTISQTSELLFAEVYPDGMNKELSAHYHGDYAFKFRDYYNIANQNGRGDAYSAEYQALVKKTFDAAMGFYLPNFRRTSFGDGWPRISSSPSYFTEYQDSDTKHEYLATKGSSGTPFKSTVLDWGGYYGLRSDWGFNGGDGIGMILKSGDEAEWHNQPDNLTFELRAFGRTLISDASQQAYGSSDPDVIAMRDKYKQTRVHNTVTYNLQNSGFAHQLNRFAEAIDAGSFNYDLIELQNQSYSQLKHQRTVLLINNQYFVLVDKLSGSADGGTIYAHFQFANENEMDKAQQFNPNHSVLDSQNLEMYTTMPVEGSRQGNLLIKGWPQNGLNMIDEMQGIGPYATGAGFGVIATGMNEFERRASAFSLPRTATDQYFVTALIPFKGDNSNGSLTPSVTVEFDKNSQTVSLTVNGDSYQVTLPSGDALAVDTDGDGVNNLVDSNPFDAAIP
ncbi:heparinase II/III family protein [Paraferrimonas sp. SM1919]|uniref:heparinase II/III family protein n=1 Tax=Paraferrimonas sp. SM1919 TaxID=2662263 RepID=UPI0013D69325|nr:heparinase II/III family protein [Paraferrimonas sp. SM1919]